MARSKTIERAVMIDERVRVRAAKARLQAGFPSVAVAGRIVLDGGRVSLQDASGSVTLTHAPTDAHDGDLVRGLLTRTPDGGHSLGQATVATRRTAPPAAADRDLPARLPVLAQRAAIVRALRAFFDERGFLEASTPARVVCPGLEPHLVPLAAGPGRWLITSPELHLKRLLAAGAERVYELAHVWRGDEAGAQHLEEFTLLEWYRAWDGLDALVDDVAGLLRACARAAGVDPAAVRGCDLSLAPERLTVREAFRRYAGVDLALLRAPAALRGALDATGLEHAPGDDWDDLFFRLFLARVEPHLGRGRVTILEEYPASQAALARVRDDPEWPVALRFEIYAAGIELGNAFDELTDAVEQRRRHEADRAWRRAHGREVPDLDEAFLAALAAGHPPAAGIALGVDRLVALILGASDLRDVVAFS